MVHDRRRRRHPAAGRHDAERQSAVVDRKRQRRDRREGIDDLELRAAHRQRQLPSIGEHEADRQRHAFAANHVQRFEHLLRIEPVGGERARQRLEAQLVLADTAGYPRFLDLRHRLEAPLNLARDQMDLLHVGPGHAHVRGRIAERADAARAEAVLAAAVEARRPQLDAVEALEGRADLLAHAPGRDVARVARGTLEMHGQRAADLLERAFDQLDPGEREDRLLRAAEYAAGRSQRSAAGHLDLERHLLRLRSLLGQTADQNPRHRDNDRQHDRDGDAGEPWRRPPQRRLQHGRQHRARALRRRCAVLTARNGTALEARDGRPRGEALREQRHEADRDDERREQREQNGDGHQLERAADEAVLDEEERRQEDDGIGRARGDDRPYRALDAADRRGRRRHAALEQPLHGFEDDHTVVDEHADAHGEPEQRHQIEGIAAEIEQRAGHEQAHRHGHRDHRDRTQLAQEQIQHDERDHETPQRELLQPVELRLDGFGRIEADTEIDAIRRPLGAQRVDARTQRAAEPDQVRAFLLKDDQPRRIRAVDTKRTVRARGRHLDVGDMAQQHGACRVDAQLAERRDTLRLAVEHHLPAPPVALGAAEMLQPLHRLAEPRCHRLGPNAERGAAFGVDPDGDLARRTARRQHLAHAGQRRDPRPNARVDEIA